MQSNQPETSARASTTAIQKFEGKVSTSTNLLLKPETSLRRGENQVESAKPNKPGNTNHQRGGKPLKERLPENSASGKQTDQGWSFHE